MPKGLQIEIRCGRWAKSAICYETSKEAQEIEMDFEEVIAGIAGVRVTGPATTHILGVACDSRKVTRDSLFFALPGEKANGNEFVASAIARGAVAVASPLPRLPGIAPDVAWVELMPGEERRALARAAANFYRHPADTLQLVGVTGTNGKTTTRLSSTRFCRRRD